MLSEWHQAAQARGKKLKAERLAQRRTCKDCGVEKVWKYSHKSGMASIFRDGDGRVWLGAVCAPCAYLKYK
jgi:hypothetical protein